MSGRLLIPLLALLSALAAAPAAAQPPASGIVRPTTESSTPSTQLGEQLFAGNCSSCHGIDGSGISRPRPGAGGVLGAGPSLKGVGAAAADFYLRTGLMPLRAAGSEPTPDRVLFSETEIESLVAYVSSLGPGPAIPAPDAAAGSIAQGFAAFTLHCAGCHQVVARGGFVTGARVPPLQGVDSTEIAEAVRLGPYLMPSFSTKQISNAELNSIIRYVRSTREPADRGGWGIGNLGPIPEGLVAWWIAIPLMLCACLVVSRRVRR